MHCINIADTSLIEASTLNIHIPLCSILHALLGPCPKWQPFLYSALLLARASSAPVKSSALHMEYDAISDTVYVK